MKSSKVRWASVLGIGPVNQLPATNEMLDELSAVKRAAWRMFCACITLFILNVILSVTSWQQFRDIESLSRSLEHQLEAKR